MKLPSPETKPANQLGSLILGFLFKTKGLVTGITSGKADFTSRERPRFIDALIATILQNLSLSVLYSLSSVNLIICLNNLKSANLSVFTGGGYLSQQKNCLKKFFFIKQKKNFLIN